MRTLLTQSPIASTLDQNRRSSPRWLHPLIVAVLCFLTALVFWQSLRAGFVFWDDDTEIIQNPHIEGLTSANITWAFTNYDRVRRYQPLDWLSWQLNYQIQGRAPLGYHLGNLLEHLVCVVLLYFLILKLLRIWADSRPRGGLNGETKALHPLLLPVASAAGALWWAIHPLRVEPVVWATGRLYTQCTMFLIASFLAYLYSVASPLSRQKKLALYGVSILCFACSLLSYAIVVGGAVGLLLLDFYPLRRIGRQSSNGWRSKAALRVIAEKIPYFAIALAVGVMTLWARIHVKGIWSPPPTLAQFPLGARIMQAFYTVAYYLYANWAPFHLSPLYTRLVNFDPNGLVFWASVFVVVLISIVSLAMAKRWPWLLVAWGYHLVMLAPLLGLSEHPHYTNDRYAQMESLVFAVLVAAALVFVATRERAALLKKIVPAVCGLIILCWGVLSYAQTRVWMNSEALFGHMLAELGDDPYRADIFWRLGVVYLEEGRAAEAVPLLKETLRGDPTNWHALSYLEQATLALANAQGGTPPNASTKQDMYRQVAQAYDRAGAIVQQTGPLRVAAKYYALAGDWADAAARLETVMSVETDESADRLELARIYHEAHRDADAREQLDLAVKADAKAAAERDRLLALWAATGTAPATMR
jgi:tetratricopeptide (TPR) repeat protein